MPSSPELHPGLVCWAERDPSVGREQAARRPVLIVSSRGYLRAVDALAEVRRWLGDFLDLPACAPRSP